MASSPPISQREIANDWEMPVSPCTSRMSAPQTLLIAMPASSRLDDDNWPSRVAAPITTNRRRRRRRSAPAQMPPTPATVCQSKRWPGRRPAMRRSTRPTCRASPAHPSTSTGRARRPAPARLRQTARAACARARSTGSTNRDPGAARRGPNRACSAPRTAAGTRAGAKRAADPPTQPEPTTSHEHHWYRTHGLSGRVSMVNAGEKPAASSDRRGPRRPRHLATPRSARTIETSAKGQAPG